MITREADYAMRAIVYLKQNKGALVGSSILAEEMEIPYRFLKKIVRRLVDVGFIESVRGKNGGIRLAIAADKISLYALIEAFDPKAMKLNVCTAPSSGGCDRSKECTIHQSLVGLQKEIDAKLREVTFNDF